MARNRIVTELRADSAQLRSEFGKADTSVGKFTSGISGSTKALAGFAAGALGIKSIIGLFGSLVDSASNLSETISKTNAVFGDSNTTVKWAEGQAKGLGLSTKTALDFASRFGGALKEIGGKTEQEAELISRQLVGLSSDLASFFNTDQDEAKEAIAAALGGEFAQLKKFNVIVNEAMLKERAFQLGISDGKSVLDARTKQIVSLDLIYQRTTDAQGDFTKTSGGMANQQRILAAELENTKAKLGEELMPAQLEFIKVMRSGVELLTEFTPALKAGGEMLVSLTQFMVDHSGVFLTIIKTYASYRLALGASTLLLGASTIATGLNTAAVLANSKAKIANSMIPPGRTSLPPLRGDPIRSSSLDWISVASAAVAVAGYKAGEIFGDKFAEGMDFDDPNLFNDTKTDQTRARAKQLDIDREIAILAKAERISAEFHLAQLNKLNLLNIGIAETRKASNALLKTEINTIAAGVLAAELAGKTQEEQLDAQQAKMDKLVESAKAFAKANGITAPGEVSSESLTDLARAAAGNDQLDVAKQLLILAGDLKSKKEEILTIEEKLKSEAKALADAEEAKAAKAGDFLDEVARKDTAQKEALREEAQELTILKLKAAGFEAQAKALEDEIELRKRAKQIAEQTGITEENALKLARQKSELQIKIDGKEGGLDNRFDEEGNRKMARDGKRKKIVLIRADKDNKLADAAARNLRDNLAAKEANENPILSKTDRLIDLAERQLRSFEKIQTSS